MSELSVVQNISLKLEQLKECIFSKETLDVEEKILEKLAERFFGNYNQINGHVQVIDNYFFYLETVNKIQDEQYKERFGTMLLSYFGTIDPSATAMIILSIFLFRRVIQFLGTEQHTKYYKAAARGDIIGALCLTEVAHGSNVKLLQTTATYLIDKEVFALNTPSFEAGKCWSENIGLLATHAVVYAQLYMQNGKYCGLVPFVVPIRNSRTLLPYPGVAMSSLGEKLGFNNGDHGLLVFQNYHIPRESLLNKFADVTREGDFVVQNQSRLSTALFEILSTGRIDVICTNLMLLRYALTTASRIASSKESIVPNLHNHVRLMPYISAYYVGIIFTKHLREIQNALLISSDETSANRNRLGVEIHLISSSAKCLFTNLVRDGTSYCLEACGTLGYLASSAIPSMKYTSEAGCTAEGTKEVLVQQVSNFLIKTWRMVLEKREIMFPMNSVNFLNQSTEILNCTLKSSSSAIYLDVKSTLGHYKWLVCYLLKKSYEKMQMCVKEEGKEPFWAIHDNQIYFCKELTYTFIEHYVIQKVSYHISKMPHNSVKLILTKLLSLYAMWSLHNYVTFFYHGGYAAGSEFGQFLEDGILSLSQDLASDAALLTNAIALPDFICALGQSNNDVFQVLENIIPNWTNDAKKKLNSKL